MAGKIHDYGLLCCEECSNWLKAEDSPCSCGSDKAIQLVLDSTDLSIDYVATLTTPNEIAITMEKALGAAGL